MYQVINRVTKQVVGTYKTKRRARTALDKKDNNYGAYVHYIQEVTQ